MEQVMIHGLDEKVYCRNAVNCFNDRDAKAFK